MAALKGSHLVDSEPITSKDGVRAYIKAEPTAWRVELFWDSECVHLSLVARLCIKGLICVVTPQAERTTPLMV